MRHVSSQALHQVRQFLDDQRRDDCPDSQLLEQFVDRRDEAAFGALVRRHGPMVLGVCRRLLGQAEDAEDAFQATFLVLARRAGSVRKRQSLASWLHGVAARVARKAARTAARRRLHERRAAVPVQREPGIPSERCAALDEELARLPESFRAPLLLCYLEGQPRAEVARLLGLQPRTLKARLQRGRDLLRQALVRRGFPPTAITAPAVPAALAGATVRHAAGFAAGTAIPASVLRLAEGALPAGAGLRVQALVLVLLALGGLFLGAAGPSPERRASDQQPAPVVAGDRFGDALPAGARARLGTVRFRQGGSIYHVALSPDGKLLASCGLDEVVHLFDVPGGRPVRTFPCRGGSFAVAFSPDGRTLAAASSLGDVHLWDVRTGKETHCFSRLATSCLSLAFSPDGKVLAGACSDVTCLWRLSDSAVLRRLPSGDSVFRSLSFSADGRTLATAGDGKSPRLVDPATGKERLRLADRGVRIHCVALSPDGKVVAAGYEDGLLLVWDAAAGKLRHTLTGHRGHSSVTALAFTPDGKTLISTGRIDRFVRLWDVAGGKEVARLGVETYDGASVAVCGTGKMLAVGGDNHVVRLWRRSPKAPRGWEELSHADSHQSQVTVLAFSPDGRTLASGGWHGPARLWDVASARPVGVAGGKSDHLHTLAFAPEGRSLVIAGSDFRVHWRQPRTGKALRSLPWRPESYPRALGFRDGKGYLAGRNGSTVDLLELTPGGRVRSLVGHEGGIDRVAFAPDGRMFASAAGDRMVRLWDLSSGKTTRIFADVASVRAMDFSPRGRLLATGLTEGVVQVWDTASGKRLLTLKGHESAVTAVAFSADTRWLASGGQDRTVRLWELASGKAAVFRGHAGTVGAVAFAPDGRTLASGSADTTILLWDLVGGRPSGTLAALWEDLASDDLERARRAHWALVLAPRQAVPFLADRLRRRCGVDARRVEKLIAELDDDEFRIRERATAELRGLGDVAEAALRKALTSGSLEVRLRAAGLLAALDPASRERERLRLVRAVAVLVALADAFQETGCANRALLDHLRTSGPHVRGFLAVDLLVGKK